MFHATGKYKGRSDLRYRCIQRLVVISGLFLRVKPTCRTEPGAEHHLGSLQVPRKTTAGNTYSTDLLVSNTHLLNLLEDPDYSWMTLMIKSGPITLAWRWNTHTGHAGSSGYLVNGILGRTSPR